jgi:perosamine synthetase
MDKMTIPWAKPKFLGLEKKYLADALNSSWISGGPYVDCFERDFAKAINSPFVLTTSNGTTALLLTFLALGIGPGDEVIIPGFTFVAPANMAITLGAAPVFVDVDPDSWLIDDTKIEQAITPKTRAICAVHLYGNVCNMDVLKAICRKHKLFLVEDTAEAAFSRYKGQYAGTFSTAGTFSFQATKSITMGEGGCVAVNNKKLFTRMKVIRNHGMNRKKIYWHTLIGHNFRLPNLQAALGCAQLERAGQIISHKKRVYGLYQKYLGNINGISMQQFKKGVDPVVWAIALKLDPRAFKASRDTIGIKMLRDGIETRPGFYPFQSMPVYRRYIKKILPVSKEVGANVISLPSFPQLEEGQIKAICKELLSFKEIDHGI